ncbi:hypothetical protein ABZX93_35655 [Streptomyces sp. NPDC006632]|uniref:hypothetical protein n=1 Tax=Streptomyces sp. NPDC006632 TaxID=3157182 RepID=UPI0033BC42AA
MSYADEAARIATAVAGLPVRVRKWVPDARDPRRRFAGWEAAQVAGPAAEGDFLAWGIEYSDGREASVQWPDVMFSTETFQEAVSRLASSTA